MATKISAPCGVFVCGKSLPRQHTGERVEVKECCAKSWLSPQRFATSRCAVKPTAAVTGSCAAQPCVSNIAGTPVACTPPLTTYARSTAAARVCPGSVPRACTRVARMQMPRHCHCARCWVPAPRWARGRCVRAANCGGLRLLCLCHHHHHSNNTNSNGGVAAPALVRACSWASVRVCAWRVRGAITEAGGDASRWCCTASPHHWWRQRAQQGGLQQATSTARMLRLLEFRIRAKCVSRPRHKTSCWHGRKTWPGKVHREFAGSRPKSVFWSTLHKVFTVLWTWRKCHVYVVLSSGK